MRITDDLATLSAEKRKAKERLDRTVKSCNVAAGKSHSVQAVAQRRLLDAIAVAEEFEVVGSRGRVA